MPRPTLSINLQRRKKQNTNLSIVLFPWCNKKGSSASQTTELAFVFTWCNKKATSAACDTALICLLPWPSFVSVSSFPAHTGKGLLGCWGAGTRFQLHMLIYSDPFLGPSCWGHRCTVCQNTHYLWHRCGSLGMCKWKSDVLYCGGRAVISQSRV